MAITLRTRILVWATADGESDSFAVDLYKSPYWVGEHSPTGIGGRTPNWFTERPAALPCGVAVVDGAMSAALTAGTSLITIGMPIKPAGFIHRITLDLLFDAAVNYWAASAQAGRQTANIKQQTVNH